jgi:hypothetical protein
MLAVQFTTGGLVPVRATKSEPIYKQEPEKKSDQVSESIRNAVLRSIPAILSWPKYSNQRAYWQSILEYGLSCVTLSLACSGKIFLERRARKPLIPKGLVSEVPSCCLQSIVKEQLTRKVLRGRDLDGPNCQ